MRSWQQFRGAYVATRPKKILSRQLFNQLVNEQPGLFLSMLGDAERTMARGVIALFVAKV